MDSPRQIRLLMVFRSLPQHFDARTHIRCTQSDHYQCIFIYRDSINNGLSPFKRTKSKPIHGDLSSYAIHYHPVNVVRPDVDSATGLHRHPCPRWTADKHPRWGTNRRRFVCPGLLFCRCVVSLLLPITQADVFHSQVLPRIAVKHTASCVCIHTRGPLPRRDP